MAWNSRTISLVGTILLPLLAASGCTGTDVITAGNGTVRFNVTLNNVDKAARFNNLGFTINQIQLSPLDEDAAAALGANVGIIRNQLTVNLAGEFFGSDPVAIPAGSYVLDSFDIVAVQAQDTDTDGYVASSDTCEEYLNHFPQSGRLSFASGSDFDPPVVVNLNANTPNLINLNIDVDKYLAAMARAWLCQQYSNCPNQTDPRTVWCFRQPPASPTFLNSLFKGLNGDPATQYFSFD